MANGPVTLRQQRPALTTTKGDFAMDGFDYTNEEWRTISIAPNYEVSNYGRVRRATDGFRTYAGRILSTHIGRRWGYHLIGLCINGKRKTYKVHRLVCEAFHGPPPVGKTDVAHGDGCRTNNRADNLRWATRAENMADMVAHGRSHGQNGSKSPNAKLTEADVLAIRAAPKRRGLLYELSAKYGVTRAVIGNIRTKTSPCWNHIR